MTTQKRRQKPDDANARERALQALRLRKLGFTYDDIAKECGYFNRGVAWNAVQRLLHKNEMEETEAFRTLEAMRLDDLMRPFMLRAMKGEADAAAVVLRIMARRDALLGLDIVRSPAGRPPEEVRREYVGVPVSALLNGHYQEIRAEGSSADTLHN